jgi:hypothetical protein
MMANPKKINHDPDRTIHTELGGVSTVLAYIYTLVTSKPKKRTAT